jgi:hypothetical protein
VTFQGDYDANLYDPADPATWPQPTDPTDPLLYQPLQSWRLSAPAPWNAPDGVVELQPGDMLYAYAAQPRGYGAGRYGDTVYGGPDDRDWLPDQVGFTHRITTLHPWNRDPVPGAGCPLVGGWRIVVEWLGNWDPAARLYGTLTYGAGFYGDESSSGGDTWNDITEHVTATAVTTGNTGGESYQVNVASAVVDVFDEAGTVLAVPASFVQPKPGTRVRVGVLDPAQTFHSLYVGRIETIADDHDAPPRIVTVESFGHLMDLVHIAAVNRPAETADVRMSALIAAGWSWDRFTLLPAVPGPALTAYTDDAAEIRAHLDRAAISAGWSVDTDGRGRLRALSWPLPAGTPVVDVSDCVDEPTGSLPAISVRYQSDMAELLTQATVTTTAQETDTAADRLAVEFYGLRTNAVGFPIDELDTTRAAAVTLAQRAVARYANAVERVESFTVDCDRHPAWLPVLARLRRGDTVRVHRTAVAPVSMDAVVTGIEHQLIRGGWYATVHLTNT